MNTSFIKVFFVVFLIQALVVITLEFYMYYQFGTGDYLDFRFYFLDNDYGDIYTYGSGFYNVQLKGNALLPFAFMISMYFYNYKKNTGYLVLAFIFLISVVCAGNLAFYISIFLFVLYYNVFCLRTNKNSILNFSVLSLLIGMTVVYGINEFIRILSSKASDGDASSIGTRFDQFSVLITDLSSTVYSLILGNGFGNLIKIVTSARDYSEYIYYELQTVYFLNQMGVILFILFFSINLVLTFNYITNGMLRCIYVLYILYASTNPYILDTNHMVVIITLVSLSSLKEKGYI